MHSNFVLGLLAALVCIKSVNAEDVEQGKVQDKFKSFSSHVLKRFRREVADREGKNYQGLGKGKFQEQSKYCAFNKQHTVCKFPDKSAPPCGKLLKRGLKIKEIREAVDKHNALRTDIAEGTKHPAQPAAADMILQHWDNEVSFIAQRWVDQCKSGHDDIRDAIYGNPAGTKNGQNFASSSASDPTVPVEVSKMIQGWFDEIKDFNKANINPFKSQGGPATGHYTQVVWAASSHIGCGYNRVVDRTMQKQVLVCNYAPLGNFMGKSMYLEGKACSKCPEKYKKCKQSLCQRTAW